MQMKRLVLTDFATGEKKEIDTNCIVANHLEWDLIPNSNALVSKIDAVVEALTAAANVLDDISYNDINMKSRMAGVFAAQAMQLHQQINVLESLVQ